MQVKFVLGLVAALMLAACEDAKVTPVMGPPVRVIPQPANVQFAGGAYSLPARASVSVPAGEDALAVRFTDLVARYTGMALNIAPGGAIQFVEDATVEGDEAYRLEVTVDGVTVRASGPAGRFYGAMTLAQMLDGGIPGQLAALPIGTIEDAPRLKWRGAMLDVGRHFRDVAFVKKFIDAMAAHKLNVFHWHLTDDQGWRIEIKKYPKLTEIGGCRVPAGDGPRHDIDAATGKPRLYCGYYSQADIREVVAYAAARHITVMPEIDIPGHATAAVAAYPELGTVAPYEGDMADWGIFENTFNLEDSTIAFLEGVMDEVLDLFPSTFVHIGGDEVATRQWANSPRIRERMTELGIDDIHDVQAYFTRHFADYLAARDRRLIGWDEILEGGSIADSAIMSWRGTEGGVRAAKAGRQVVMAPSSIYYTDYRQSASRYEEPGREHIQTLRDVYEFEPVSAELTADEQAAVMGAEMTVFTEHMRTEARVEYMAFPRLVAMAESVWSMPEGKDFGGFVARLMPQMARLKALGITPADSAFAPTIDVAVGEDGARTITLTNQVGQGDLRYTLDGSAPTATSPLYRGPVAAGSNQTVTAAAFTGDVPLSRARARALDRESLSERTSDELRLCTKDLAIKLDDDFPASGPRAAMLVDIVGPCWMYDTPDMAGVTGLKLTVGNLPYNFQIGDLINKVRLDKPQTDAGEIVVYKDTCDGVEVVRLPLAPARESYGLTTLTAPLEVEGAKALCFRVASHHHDPLWAIERVRLTSE